MRSFARRFIAVLVAAALNVSGWAPALAETPAAPAAPAAPAVSGEEALRRMKSWGVLKDDNDVLKSYLIDGSQLTPIGKAVYESLSQRYSPTDAAAALQPAFDALRERGPYDATSRTNADQLVSSVQAQLNSISAGSPNGPANGSDESIYRTGALTQAAVTGAAVVDPPNPSDLSQLATPHGVAVFDKHGLIYEMNQNNSTVYNRELQKNQHTMNQHPVPQVPFVPETGRYNQQTFDYTYWTLKNNYDALADAARRDRMIAIAQLLNRTYPDDLWFTDKTLEPDLIKDAKAKVYSQNGKTYSVWDIVSSKMAQRYTYLDAALKAVDRYKADETALIGSLGSNPIVRDSAVKSLQLDEQSARLALTRTTVSTQMYYVDAQGEALDPGSPDSKQVLDALDKLDLTPAQRVQYRERARQMVARLQQVRLKLDGVRGLLDRTDAAGSLASVNSILGSVQTLMSEISTDYSLYVTIPTVAALAHDQTNVHWWDGGNRLVRGLYGVVDSGYKGNMSQLASDGAQYRHILDLIINDNSPNANLAAARQAAIAMNPHAADNMFTSALFGDSKPTITDDLRISASLKANRDRVISVLEKNKWLDAAGSLLDWSVVIGLGGGVASRALRGLAYVLEPVASMEASEGASLMNRAVIATTRRTSIILRESALHTAARLETLESTTSRAWVDSRFESTAMRYLANSGVRAANQALRQATFTAMSAGISGGFVLGNHWYTEATGGHSQYMNTWGGTFQALADGAKGGAWWANESWHPALNYVGLPASAFRGTWAAKATEVLGSRGAVDSAWSLLGATVTGGSKLAAKIGSWVMPTASEVAGEGGGGLARMLWPTAEGGVSKGLMDRLAETGTVGKFAAFPLSMADNVAKYALVSEGASGIGHWVAYNAPSISLPFVGQVTWGSEQDQERRIKGANATGGMLMNAPIWLALPTFAAHAALEAQPYMNGPEGMRQYDAAGLTHEYANAKVGEELPFQPGKEPKVPISQRLFDIHIFRDPPRKTWIVTEEIRLQGIQKEMVKAVGGEKATPAQVNPLVFQSVMRMEDGQLFVNLKVNDEVRSVAYQNFVKSLLADPVRAKAILEAPVGTVVPGVGKISPEFRKDAAVALYSSEILIGKSMPGSLAKIVGDILKPYLEANLVTREPAYKLATAARGLVLRDSFAGDNGVLAKIREQVTDWKEKKQPAGVTYKEFLVELRRNIDVMQAKGDISPAEGEVLSRLYDYVESIDKRFNSFNNVEKAFALADESLMALVNEFKSRPAPTVLLGSFRRQLKEWQKTHRPDDPAYGKADDRPDSYASLIKSLRSELDGTAAGMSAEELHAVKNLTDGDRAALEKAIKEMEAAPWAVHDQKGTAIKGWHPTQPEQFEALMGALTAFIARRPMGSVRVFQLLKTGGGKTLVAFEGLLPLVEADAAYRGKDVRFLTTQSNLKAQAQMDFIAFKKIGSKITFDTYDSLRAKTAEGKLHGDVVTRKSFFLLDEMDGAAQEAATTMGQTTGRVSRLAPAYARMEALDQGLGEQLGRAESAEGTSAQTEARRAQFALRNLDAPDAGAARDALAKLDEAAGRLASANGPLQRGLAQAELRDLSQSLDGSLDALSRGRGPDQAADVEALATARDSLGRLRQVLDAPAEDAKLRSQVAAQVETVFRHENNLLRLAGSEEGLARLSEEAQIASDRLGDRIASLTGQTPEGIARRIESLTREAAAQDPSSPEAASLRQQIAQAQRDLAAAPGRAGPLGDEIALVTKEKAMVDQFVAVDAGHRLTGLQDRIAQAEGGGAPAPELAGLKQQAAKLEQSLSPEARSIAQSRAEALGRLYSVGRELKVSDDAIVAAKKTGGPTPELLSRRAGLEADYSTVRAEIARLKSGLSAGSASSDLGGLLRRIEVLRSEGSSSEIAGLVKTAETMIRDRLKASADEIVKVVRAGGEGWQDAARRLLDQRRVLAKAFAGDVNPIYEVFGKMKSDVETFAMSEKMRSTKEADYKQAQLRFDKFIDGQKLGLFETASLVWKTLTGREIDMAEGRIGRTRLRAAEMIQAIAKDPTMPAHEADGLFWNLLSSILFPRGVGGRSVAWLEPGELKAIEAKGERYENRGSSWMRTELRRMLNGYFEDQAGIRYDSLSGRTNVVHNGQWFEAMDNETRRYWELVYGADLTMPYTHQAISTIKDLTTDKETNFIAFSGTAGEKLLEHFKSKSVDIMVVGKGSSAPPNVEMKLTARATDSYYQIGQMFDYLNSRRGAVVLPDLAAATPEVRQAIVDRAGGGLPQPVTLRLDAFRAAGHEADLAWLQKNGVSQGDGVVSVRSVDGAPEDVRLAARDALSGPLTVRV